MSVLIVFFAAIIYGFYPHLFTIFPTSVNELAVLKSIMGLYFACTTLWVMGLYYQDYWKTATICNAFFMLGLGFGRCISFLVDGLPSVFFILGTIGEFVLGFYALLQLKKFNQNKII